MSAPDPDTPRTYAVRLTPAADRDLIEAMLRLEELTGDEGLAADWRRELRERCGELSTDPHRYVVLPRETRLMGAEVRHIRYQRTSGSAVYHAYYTVTDDGPDGPLVVVFHIRHASRRPLTPKEARALREEL